MSIFVFGFGMFCLKGQIVIDLVCNVFDVGYCVIDIVQIYDNEVEVGQVIVDVGLVCDELFFIIKIWIVNVVYDILLESLCESLCKLCIDYVELMLIYWFLFKDVVLMVEYLGVLVEVKVLGLIWQIGIFNFIIVQICQVIGIFGVDVIVINQIEVYFYLQNCVLIVFLKDQGIYVIVYMSLVYGEVLKDLVIQVIVDCYQVILVQVVLVWVLQQGYVVIFFFIRCENLVSNLLVVDLYLGEVDMVQIVMLDCGQCLVNFDGIVLDWD